MLREFHFDMARYNPTKSREDIAAIYVTAYYSNRIMRAEERLLFVLGSDVPGSTGCKLIAVKGESPAKTFLLEHNRMLRFEEITPADIPDRLNAGRDAHSCFLHPHKPVPTSSAWSARWQTCAPRSIRCST